MTGSVSITGATRLYAIIGDPIAQVRSPEVFGERFAGTGANTVLVPAHVPAQRFDAIVPALLALGNLDGLLVTVPFKARMVRFADRLGTTASCVGAINALRREADGSWTGEMFDGAGFVRGADRKGLVLRGRRVALFGAGGAGSAIACALAGAGVESIRIIDVAAGRSEALVERLGNAFPECAMAVGTRLPEHTDMVVNASPVGMQAGDGMPGEIGPLAEDVIVGDTVISQEPTALIRHAVRHGCRFVDGRDMHAGQVDAILAFFAAASRASNG